MAAAGAYPVEVRLHIFDPLDRRPDSEGGGNAGSGDHRLQLGGPLIMRRERRSGGRSDAQHEGEAKQGSHGGSFPAVAPAALQIPSADARPGRHLNGPASRRGTAYRVRPFSSSRARFAPPSVASGAREGENMP